MLTDEAMFTLRTGLHRTPALPISAGLDMAVERARACRLHALVNGDFGHAVKVELAWQAQRAALLRMMARFSWTESDADAEVASRERTCDAAIREIMDVEPGLSLERLLHLLME